jgi:hypothetical protein
MGYFINALKSSYFLLNYGTHKSVYRDGQNVRKDIHNIPPLSKKEDLGINTF